MIRNSHMIFRNVEVTCAERRTSLESLWDMISRSALKRQSEGLDLDKSNDGPTDFKYIYPFI